MVTFGELLRNLRGAKFRRDYVWIFRKVWSLSPVLVTFVSSSLVINSLIPTALAVLFGVLIGSVRDALDADTPDIFKPVMWFTLILALMLFSSILTALEKYFSRKLQDELNIRLSREVFQHAAPLDLQFFEDPDKQDILARSTSNIGDRFFQAVFGSINLVSSVVQLLSLTVVLMYIDALVTSVLLSLSVPWLIFQLHMAKIRFQADIAKTRQHRWTGYYTEMFTDRANIPTVKLLALDALLLGRFEETLRNILAIDRRTYRLEFLGELVAAIVLTVGFWVAILYVGTKTFEGQISFEMMLTYWIASGRFRATVDGVVGSVAGLVESTLFVDHISKFFDQQPTLASNRGKQVTNDLSGRIELKDVSFKYPGSDNPVLRSLNLTVEPGETVAFVGHNGAGKTTVAKLILRLYDVTEGAVLIDQEDIKTYNLQSLYRHVAYVPDTPVAFEATLRENIAFGNWSELENDGSEVRELANLAGLSQVLESSPHELETVLGRQFGMHDLSTGQWQKVSLARAFARDASIYILDEPTANLDVRSEAEIFRAFSEFAKDRTTILISHRFSTVRMADRIFVLQDGEFVEHGSHDELMHRGGIYATLYRLHRGGAVQDK